MFVWFCNDMSIASAILKKNVFNVNDFATGSCKRCVCVDEDVWMIGMKGKKNSLKCYSTVCPEKLWEIYQMSI